MSRVGFKKSFPVGSMDATTVFDSLYQNIKTFLTAAWYVTVVDDVADPGVYEYFYVIQAGAESDAAHDDVPSWMIGFEANAPVICLASARYDDTYSSAGIPIASSDWNGGADSEIWFAADGAAGWWWLAQMHVDAGVPSGYTLDTLTVGSTVRRYLADRQTGIVARYGLVQIDSTRRRWMPAYAIGSDGTELFYGAFGTAPLYGSPVFDLFSPLGGMSLVAFRHPGSVLPLLAAPVFPSHPVGSPVSAAMLGELEAIMQLTDGHVLGDLVVPGWIALSTGDPEATPAVALPAPDAFVTLP
ncbi:MAG: hypothetical protein D4S02_11400 [Rhodocyclaceae bacterium]|nr:MAG: hypothetical protein D4S02_11400 [Rhodocyclaceae bacterium]